MDWRIGSSSNIWWLWYNYGLCKSKFNSPLPPTKENFSRYYQKVSSFINSRSQYTIFAILGERIHPGLINTYLLGWKLFVVTKLLRWMCNKPITIITRFFKCLFEKSTNVISHYFVVSSGLLFKIFKKGNIFFRIKWLIKFRNYWEKEPAH